MSNSKFKVGDRGLWNGVEYTVVEGSPEGAAMSWKCVDTCGWNPIDVEGYTLIGQDKKVEKVAVVPPHGGPSKYYDFPFSEWVTSNDQMEYFATNKWLQYSLHLKDVFKACCRWGDKEGTSLEYDARKIVYSGLRLLMMIKGKKVVQEYLKELVEDQQFKG